jgi:hypothetical protein
MNIEDVPKKSKNNIEELDKYEVCGCYFCIHTFEADEILEFTDDGTTALCPNCSVDAIIPGMVNGFFLEKAHERWFK